MGYQEQADHVVRCFEAHGEALSGAFAVLSPTKLRIRTR